MKTKEKIVYTTIKGVTHTLIRGNAINYHQAQQRIQNVHPNGDIYVVGNHGYVQSGGSWLRFQIKYLDKFKE